MALKNRGEAPFPAAGEGCFFRFTLADIAKMEEIYGVGAYFQAIEQGLSEGSGHVVMLCIEHGLRKRDEHDKVVRVKMDPLDINFSASEAFEPIMDAICIAAANLTYQETMQEVARRRAEMEEAIKAVEEPEEDPLAGSGE